MPVGVLYLNQFSYKRIKHFACLSSTQGHEIFSDHVHLGILVNSYNCIDADSRGPQRRPGAERNVSTTHNCVYLAWCWDPCSHSSGFRIHIRGDPALLKNAPAILVSCHQEAVEQSRPRNHEGPGRFRVCVCARSAQSRPVDCHPSTLEGSSVLRTGAQRGGSRPDEVTWAGTGPAGPRVT